MKGILLVNMGGPQSLSEMRLFLKNMFSDKYILPLPFGIRQFVANMIAKKRHPSSWEKYQLIGGTPIIKHTEATGKALAEQANLPVYTAYSYTPPFIADVLDKMVADGVDEIDVLTMYPQASDTTTTSVFTDVKKAAKKLNGVSIREICDYSVHPTFLEYWKTLIEEHIEREGLDNPLLLFTAHAIPMYGVKRGDKYPDTVKHMAKRLAGLMNRRYEVAFQSRVGPVKWVGPDTDDHLEELVVAGEDNVVLIPLSFTTECLETVYDLNIKLVDIYKTDERVKHISRVEIPVAHPLFIETLKRVVNE
ncbi:ferrochelatase [Carboxylicivirga mesophila]|uniref:Ferrochelatase n=1 Tax=Carboxylicivirga mesophila TaxID=1166478 RepID=A0ABS5K7J9_9BACT|nr:ferrochelatase [Carboxylicivirga mesophila]MBS2210503.1 ferrochelatase [Carboxylicivirga mesophila]